MLNITYYQRKAKKNYNEVSPHTSQNGHHKKKKKLQAINAGVGMEKRKHSCTVGGDVNRYIHCGEESGVSFKNYE